MPPERRVFYKVSDGKIVETKLDESTWQPPRGTTIPLRSRLPEERGTMCHFNPQFQISLETAHSSRRGIPCSTSRRRSGIATRSSESGLTGLPVRARSRRLVRAQHVHRRAAAIQISSRTLWPGIAFWLQGPLCPMDPAQLGARRAHRTVQKSRRPHLRGTCKSPRQLRRVELQSTIRGIQRPMGLTAMSSAAGQPQRVSRDCDSASPCTRLATGGGFSPRRPR